MDKKTLEKEYFLRNAKRLEDIEDYRKKCIEKGLKPKLYRLKKSLICQK